MNKIYEYFRTHKVMLWLTLSITTIAFGVFGLMCPLEENIMKLLPSADKDATITLSFSDIKVKDKMFVQVCTREGAELSQDELAGIMDEFMEAVLAGDSTNQYIASALYQIDPSLLMEAGNYLMEHAPGYLDFTDAEMDSLTSVEHIETTIQQYLQLMETPLGEQMYDLLSYDPCGIVMAKTGLSGMMDSMESNGPSRFNGTHLFSEDGRTCLAFFDPNMSLNESAKASKMIKELRKVKSDVEAAHPEVEVLWHGALALSAGNSMQTKQDLFSTILISLLIIVILLGICFKRPKYIVAMLLPIAYGAFCSLAIIHMTRGSMSLLALGLGAVVLGVAMSYCMHVLIQYIYTGDARDTVRVQTKPVLMGSITTIGAFIGLLFTQSALLQDFGLFASLAVAGTTLASLIFMPQFFPKNHEPNRKAFAFLERINAIQIDRHKWVLAIVLIFCAVCIGFSGRYTFDSDLHNINYMSDFTVRSMNKWAENTNHGYADQYYASTGKTLDEALENLPAIEAACDSLQQTGLVKSFTRTGTLLPCRSVQEKRIAHWAEYFTPEKQAQVWKNVQQACARADIDPEMFLSFQGLMAAEQEPQNLYEAGIIPESISNLFVEKVGDDWLVFFPVLTTEADKNAGMDALDDVHGCIVLDPYHYTASLVEMVHDDFSLIMLISSIFVFLLLLVSYKNLWISLIAFAPMMISWYTVLGAMAIFGQTFNMINVVISSFIFGIGVDYSIFIMDGLRKQHSDGADDKTIVYHKTAITISGTVLCICMFSLFFAKHPALHSIAFASLVGMITTIMLSYTLQPNLYRLYVKLKTGKKPATK